MIDMTTVSSNKLSQINCFIFLKVYWLISVDVHLWHPITWCSSDLLYVFFFFLELFLSLDQADLYMFPYALYV